MRADFLRIVGCIVLGLVIILGVLAAFQMLSVSPIWSDDGAAWVQAVGSVAAIWGAVWISNREQRDQRQRALAVATIAAVEHWGTLQGISQDLHIIGEQVRKEGDIGERCNVMKMLERIQSRGRLTSDQILSFDGLGSECALWLARTNSHLAAIESRLALILDANFGKSELGHVRLAFDHLSETIERAKRSLDKALIEISKATPGVVVEE